MKSYGSVLQLDIYGLCNCVVAMISKEALDLHYRLIKVYNFVHFLQILRLFVLETFCYYYDIVL